MKKRSLLAARLDVDRLTQQPAVDEFGELPARKRAVALGHDLGEWHRRPNDPYGRWNAFCRTCNMIAVVAVEAPDYFAEPVYGYALIKKCVVQS